MTPVSPPPPDAAGSPAPGAPFAPPARSGRGLLRLFDQRLSLRRALLLLLVLALLPITAISVGQGFARLKRDSEFVAQTLREGVLANAAVEGSFLTATRGILRLLAITPVVRQPSGDCSQVLERAAAGFPSYSNLLRVDAGGRVTCAAVPAALGRSVRGERWWASFSAKPRFVVGDPVFGQASRRQVVQMAYPITGPGGAFEGAVIASVDVAVLQSEFRQRHAERGAVVALLDANGRRLAASAGGALPSFAERGTAAMVRRGQAPDGREWSYSVAPVLRDRVTGRTLWLAYAVPHTRLFTTSWWQVGLDFGLPILAVLLTSLAIWLGTERLVLQWITGLRRLAAEFGEGHYRSRVMRFGGAPTEIRLLAADLYRMAGSVEERDHRLNEGLARQKTLALEVHHRVKNNLQIVLSILSLQALRLTDPAARAVIAQTRVRVSALALVHRLLYETGEVSAVGSGRLLTEIAAQVQLATRPPAGVQVEQEFDDAPLPMDTAVPVTLWLVEALSNAFAHAFGPDGEGVVLLSFHRIGGDARIEVADTGQGFDVDSVKAGNGLRLVRSIAQQLAGRAIVDSRVGEGTRVVLEFPVPATSVGREPPRVAAH